MEGNEYGETQTVTFLSGKGGAGKTSVSIGMSYLLNDAGFKVLLIDFDFATTGASYFFKYLYPKHTGVFGLYELIVEKGPDLGEALPYTHRIIMEIKEGLYFIPARTNFSRKLPLRDLVIFSEDELKSLMVSVVERFRGDFDFILIDNQAGSNLTAKVSGTISDKAIIVSELDPISSDAVDTLLIQIGDALPEYRRHLINKLDIRETEDYKDLSTLFQSMNRLPPLPFDFEVRSAFASRQVPVDVSKPTSFLIALYNSVKSFLPEYRRRMEEYGERILSKFNEYQSKVDYLIGRRKELREEIESLTMRRERAKMRRMMFISMIGIYLGVMVVVLGILGTRFLPTSESVVAIVGILMAAISASYLFLNRRIYRERAVDVVRGTKTRAELSAIDKEIDRYKSLMLTRTKEFLLHFEKPG